MSALKAALVGCGRMGCTTSAVVRANSAPGWLPLSHAEAAQDVDGVELLSLCDTDENVLGSASKVYDVDACYTDYKAMIREERPDILMIATRTPGRPELIKFAAENGVKAMHVEKPLAQSMAACNEVIEVLDKHNVILSYGTYRRYHGIYRKAVQLCEEGKIGRLNDLMVGFGRAMLMWTHPHSIDLMLMFSGGRVPEVVWGDCFYDSDNVDVEVLDEDPIVQHGYVRFSGEYTASITQAGGQSLRLCGEKGGLSIRGDGLAMTYHSHQDNHVEEFGPHHGDSGVMVALSELRDGLNNGTPTSFGLEDLELNTRLLLCLAYSTFAGGRPVRPEELPDDFVVTGRFKTLYA